MQFFTFYLNKSLVARKKLYFIMKMKYDIKTSFFRSILFMVLVVGTKRAVTEMTSFSWWQYVFVCVGISLAMFARHWVRQRHWKEKPSDAQSPSLAALSDTRSILPVWSKSYQFEPNCLCPHPRPHSCTRLVGNCSRGSCWVHACFG